MTPPFSKTYGSIAHRPRELVSVDRVRQALAETDDLAKVKNIRDWAESVRAWAKKANKGLEAQNTWAEIKLLAERGAGGLLAEMEKHPAGRPTNNRLHDATDLPPTLADLGIEKTQSHRWQLVASLPQVEFERHVEAVKAAGRELTTTGVLVAVDRRRGRGAVVTILDCHEPEETDR